MVGRTEEGEADPLLAEGRSVNIDGEGSDDDEHADTNMKTVAALFESSDEADFRAASLFTRRVFGLIVLQYFSVLAIASPFALVASFGDCVERHHAALEAVAVVGIVSSLCLAVTRGAAAVPWARAALVGLTLSVGLELGVTFASASWGAYGLVAVGQATTYFAVILALLQFDSPSLVWLTYPSAAALCLALSGLWTMVLVEAGAATNVAAGIGLGGWAFAMLNLGACHHISKHVEADQYILATLLILVPEAILFVASRTQRPERQDRPTSYEAA